MDLPKITDIDLSGKRVLVRADLDFDPKDSQNLRLASLIPTLDYIKEKGGKILLMGHRGRPEGRVVDSLSLKLFAEFFSKWGAEVFENLRFDQREEANDDGYAREIADKGDVYINEAFAASHRKHASIVGVPRLLPHAVGMHFALEVEKLDTVLVDPKKPVVFIISGYKDDKLQYIEDFKKHANKILIGGRLPDYIHDISPFRRDPQIIVGNFIADKEDITIHTIEVFNKEIAGAGTVVLSGPLGKFEEEGHRQGTLGVFKSVAQSSAFKIAGGGDTISALNVLGFSEKFDWVSVGGGAMLEFLAKGTLPGIEALVA